MTKRSALTILRKLERTYRTRLGLAKFYGQTEKQKKMLEIINALDIAIDTLEENDGRP